jgi:hypothetical protein
MVDETSVLSRYCRRRTDEPPAAFLRPFCYAATGDALHPEIWMWFGKVVKEEEKGD